MSKNVNKINLNLQNCYGIKKLKKELDFSSSKTVAIYAPNGVMKTSFAKTFSDLFNGALCLNYLGTEGLRVIVLIRDGQLKFRYDNY